MHPFVCWWDLEVDVEVDNGGEVVRSPPIIGRSKEWHFVFVRTVGVRGPNCNNARPKMRSWSVTHWFESDLVCNNPPVTRLEESHVGYG